MICPQPYRRQRWDCDAPGCDPAPGVTGPGLVTALACHKGNASQQQSSTQTGAQTGGSAVTGNNNFSNATGNQVVITPPASGSGNLNWLGFRGGDRSGGTAVSGGGTTINTTVTSGVSAQDLSGFIDQLASAIGGPASTVPTPDPGSAAAAAESDNTSSPTVTSPGTVTPAMTPLAKTLVIGVGLLLLAGAAFAFLFKKKKS